MTLFTIGFTQKTAEVFFLTLINAGVKRVVDIRLNNTSQLAGFTKKDDFIYFLKTIGGIKYLHIPELAPTRDLMESFKKKKGSWDAYEDGYSMLLSERKADESFLRKTLKNGDCLLCSESTPEHCHRRIVAEKFQSVTNNVDIVHL
jgi:uncharacterized protein (DUF488 family)